MAQAVAAQQPPAPEPLAAPEGAAAPEGIVVEAAAPEDGAEDAAALDGALTSHKTSSRTWQEIREDHVAPAPEPDAAAAVASRTARTLVFFAFCQAVQCFMSYDGGATPASLDTIQAEMNNAWTEAEFGMLGAIDKIGMTATSLIWGRALQLCSVKLLMVIGLLLNALGTLAFGLLRDKGLMYFAKVLLGATQSLQGVWATVWTVTMAPPDRKTFWLGLGGVSAGAGNGIGTAVAGFGTANGLPYAFAFQLQAAVLFALWVALLLTPTRWLAIRLPSSALQRKATDGSSPEEAAANTPAETGLAALPSTSSLGGVPGCREQGRALYANKVFVWTTLQISLVMFEVSGIQFLWVRFFVDVWSLDKSWVTTMYLLVAGVGGGIGIAVGPIYIDRLGGYSTAVGLMRTMRALEMFNGMAVLSALLGLICIYAKEGNPENAWDDWGDIWLWLLWVALGFLHLAHQASVPALTGINIEVVDERMRTFASGVEMTVRNILGFAFGPLLPALLMSGLASSWGYDVTANKAQQDKILCYGMGFILAVNTCGIVCLRKAAWVATKQLGQRQRAAMKLLQEAFMTQESSKIEHALGESQAVALHRVPGGTGVMTAAAAFLATGARDAGFGAQSSAVDQSLSETMGKTELRNKLREAKEELKDARENIDEMKKLVHSWQAESARLLEENATLRKQLEARNEFLAKGIIKP